MWTGRVRAACRAIFPFRWIHWQRRGGTITLGGTASLEGDAKPPNAAILIPVVGPFTIFKHGTNAEIKAGMLFKAYVDADLSVAAAK